MWRVTERGGGHGRAFLGRSYASLALALVSLCGCSEGDDGSDPVRQEQPLASACLEAPGQTYAPLSVVDLVERLNAMPKPVSLPCFVESLQRPMAMHASRSQFSAQPSLNDGSPRIFLFLDSLILTVVPEGMGSHLLEIGQQRTETRSMKAEIEFPVEQEIELSDPFERVLFDDGVTDCAFCHTEEEQDPSIDFAVAFVSNAIRPKPSQRVSVESLVQESRVCDAEVQPERCALLESLFAWGPVGERDFPEAMATFP